MRGLAALYVVWTHCTAEGRLGGSSRLETIFASVGRYGHVTVCVFIVLSGFCLALPVSRSDDHRLEGGLPGFVKRRARRILPPYYAALILAVAVTALLHHHAAWWIRSSREHELSMASLATHALMVHNLSPWFFSISPPLWTVATEWQIYFIYGLIMIPLWNRLGSTVAGIFAIACGIGMHYGLNGGLNIDAACPWFLALFGMGVLASEVVFARSDAARALRKLPAGPLALAVALAYLVFPSVLAGRAQLHSVMIQDMASGTLALFILIYCGVQRVENRGNWLTRVFESRLSMFLGAMSYSLYLTHYCVVDSLVVALKPTGIGPTAGVLLFYAVGIPAAVGLSYAFYLRFEKPFVRAAQRKPRPAS